MKKIAKMVLIAAAFTFVLGCAHHHSAAHHNVPVKMVHHHKCHHRHHHHHHNEKVPVNYDCDVAK